MPFQKTVSILPDVGLPGNLVSSVNQQVFTAYNCVSDGTAVAGRFAFKGTLTGNGEDFGAVSIKATAGAKPLGIVVRTLTTSIVDPLDEASETYPGGAAVTVLKRGQIFMKATAAATEGQAIICDPATGTITYGTAGAANDTGWTVRLPQGVATVKKDDLIIAENYGVDITPTAGA